MQNKAFWIGLGVIIALLIAGVAFLGMGKNKAPEATPTEAPQTSTPMPETTQDSTSEGAEVQEISIEAREFSFSKESWWS